MYTQHHDTCRAATRTTHLHSFIAGALAVAIGLANSASAALIGVSLSYDGNVRIGDTTGKEEHDRAPIFPPNNTTVPVTNGMLPDPLQPARELSASMTEFPGALNGQLGFQHVVITIQGQGGGTNNAFTNPLDPMLPYPVEFDASFYSDNLPAGKMLMLGWIGAEDGSIGEQPPYPAPGTQLVTGVGTQANPWRIQLGVSADLVSQLGDGNGSGKFHIYYKFGDLIPEPATCVTLLIALSSLAGPAARRRRP